MVPVGLLFHLFKKSNVIPQRSGFCVQWEDINAAFTAGSVDSTVETGFHSLGSARKIQTNMLNSAM